jgi:hypothetical protein
MEQIVLNPADDTNPFEKELVVNQINQQFHQESRLKGIIREFTLFNDSYLYQLIKGKHRAKIAAHINLELVDATPKRELVVAYDWLITTIFSALVSALMLYICWFSSLQIGLSTAYLITAFTLSFSAIVFLVTILKTEHRVQLLSRYGHVPVIEFINNSPSQHALAEFIALLQHHIIQTQQSSSLTTKEQLSLELKELRRLHKNSLISLSHYEQAKIEILNNSAFKSIQQ